MANSEAGWTSEWPPSGWYFMRRSGEDVTIDGTVVWVGHNKSGLRWEGQFFYSDHAFCQNREFLGPISPSDAEQLMELRKALQRMLDNFSPFASEDTERYREEYEACEYARAALNPEQPEKLKQLKGETT